MNGFSGWNGQVALEWPESRTRLTMAADVGLRHLVVYTPPGADFFCVEPVSHSVDAFNLAEQGVPGFAALSWWGVIAPAKMPPAVTKKLVEELQKALKVPAIAEKLQAQGMEIVGSGPDEANKFLKGEIDRWGKVVKDNKIKAGD